MIEARVFVDDLTRSNPLNEESPLFYWLEVVRPGRLELPTF
jgi:hypothetical protein